MKDDEDLNLKLIEEEVNNDFELHNILHTERKSKSALKLNLNFL